MSVNIQVVLYSKCLTHHFKCNKVDNNSHIIPMNTTKTMLLDMDIHNTVPQPMLNYILQ